MRWSSELAMWLPRLELLTDQIFEQPGPSLWQPLPADSSALPLIGAKTEVGPQSW